MREIAQLVVNRSTKIWANGSNVGYGLKVFNFGNERSLFCFFIWFCFNGQGCSGQLMLN